jgi:hypothetical protein
MAHRAFIWRHNNPEKRTLNSRMYSVRRRLRELGILPPVGVDMDEKQKELYKQIGDGDFSFWDTVKKRGGVGTKLHDGGTRVNSTKKIIKTAEEMLWGRSKQSSADKRITFDIDVEDIIIPDFCPITNIPISIDSNDKNTDNYYVLDRIDWADGIVKGNVRVVSSLGLRQKIQELCLNGYFENIDYTPDDIKREICIKAKRNARRRKCEFNLKPQDVIVPEYCVYLGVALSYNKKDKNESFYFSIDRIDSTKGYVKGNVQIISILANTMKNSSSQEQLITFAKNIFKIHNLS